LHRRDLLGGAIAAPLLASVARHAHAATPPAGPQAFDANVVRQAARDLAAKPYQAPDRKLPDALSKLDYDQYRAIRFRPDRALWRGGLPFQVEFFHRGFLYLDRVDVFEVVDGKSSPILYNADLFDFGAMARPGNDDIGFAGFRIHAPFNKPDYFDEICVFLGASYFRAVGKGQGYGLSARGLAIKTADPGGEEFPLFRTFWLERPAQGAGAMVVHALLDSPSASAAFRFTIRPGADTVFDVEMTLCPRVDIDKAGVAPMTSMFYFDANDRTGVDDYRRAVHDSDGLQLLTGNGDQIWRPLANPTDLQISVFGDAGPRGYGLMQSKRDFAAYDDLEARYEKRPSLWVEPIGDAGEGGVMLIEIPTREEIHDNIVAFWRPKAPLKAKAEYGFTYRLHWCGVAPIATKLAQVTDTRAGLGFDKKSRLFVLDLAGENIKGLPQDAKLTLQVSADHGKIANAVVQPNPVTSGLRASFELDTGGSKVVELRAQVMNDAAPVSEIWLYRWTS
jgi:glucans biosynthesis protein